MSSSDPAPPGDAPADPPPAPAAKPSGDAASPSASPAGSTPGSVSAHESASPWDRVRRARVPQLLGVYAGAGFGVLQVADIFVNRLGLPDWTFFGLLVVLVVGIPVVAATAMVQAGDKSLRMKELFSWKNTSLAGVGAAAVLVLVVGAFMGARAMGIGPVGSLVAAGVIERDEAILIADFHSPTGDALLAGAITEAFRIDFEQSPVVRVVAPGAVRDGLLRMGLAPDSPLTGELARELALREGIKALVLGEINRVGSGSIVSVRLVAPGSEEAIVSYRETVSDDSEIIGAVDRLSSRLRERIGESLRSIRGSDPLEQVTTPSLSALRRYSQAIRALDLERDVETGIAYLEEALAEDPEFAMAWRKLGVVRSNESHPREEVNHALTRAFELSDRLTERERLLTRAAYYNTVTGEQDRAMATYRTLLELYPAETTALNNLAVIHADRGERGQAAELLRRAIQADSSTSLYYTNLANQELNLDEWDAARQTVEALQRRFPDMLAAEHLMARITWASGDFSGAEAALRRLLDHPRSLSGDRMDSLYGLTALTMLQGRAEEAFRHMARVREELERSGGAMGPGQDLQLRSYYLLLMEQDTARAVQLVDGFLAGEGIPDEAAFEGAHLQAASFYLNAGQVERGREWLEGHDRIVGNAAPLPWVPAVRASTGAMLRFHEGDHAGAIEWAQRTVREQPDDPDRRYGLAYFHDLSGAADSALVHYEAYLDTPAALRMQNEYFTTPRVLERLGQLHEALGNRERAREFHLRFAELWQGADPPLQPRVERARARAAALAGGG
jgi:eukaryotic-like serine/threonine-protein kinase